MNSTALSPNPRVLRNEFSWSLSRDRVLRECARKYWFTHYGMWGGWQRRADPRTREFSEIYFRRHGVGATLDAPVRWRGGLGGVLCCEHVWSPRTWGDDEQAFVASLADAVTLALETDRRRAAERALLHKLAVIKAQQQDAAALASPVLEIWDGVLAMPLMLSSSVLRAASRRRRVGSSPSRCSEDRSAASRSTMRRT